MKKITAFIAHHKVYIDRARAHATYISMISLLITMLKVLGVPMHWWHFVVGIPCFILVLWVIGRIDVHLGMFQHENKRHSELNPFYTEIREQLDEIKSILTHVSDASKN